MTELTELVKIRKLLQLLVRWESQKKFGDKHNAKIADVKG